MERVRGGKTHNPYPALFSLNLLKETGAKLLSHWTWLKTEVLEHPSPKCWQAWGSQRRDQNNTLPVQWEGRRTLTLDGSVPKSLLTSTASIRCPWLLFCDAYPAAVKCSGRSVSFFPLSCFKKMRVCFKKKKKKQLSKKLYEMALRKENPTLSSTCFSLQLPLSLFAPPKALQIIIYVYQCNYL